ncbi:MAG: ABC transporter ATP-binding protein, partial [Anaeroplasmataceae bacterium]|nr:ABC transporter ATP-binding protein [Anaeroplasmataceae bacterium]
MLSVQNLCKYYDKNKLSEQYVLKNISLEFPEAGLVSIFGPSGCGKTTLLNILSGIDTPTSGEVLYNDSKITDDFRYHNVGVIFQDFGLLENKTVEENIKIGYLDASEQVLNDTLKALDILKFKDRKVSMLSGGEKQRVAIARAVIKKPAYILADEPTGNLDLKNRLRVMQILKSLSTHMLVILISHDIELASKFSDRIITLTDGEVTNDTCKTIEYKNNFEAKIKNSKFNLFSYLKDTYKIKHKTSFLMILFMLATTVLICFISANVTGYRYKSISIPNNYITFNDSLSPTIFEEIKKKGNFQYSINASSIHIPKEKDFIKSYKNLCLENTDIILYPYQNEPILSSIKIENTDFNPVYLSLKLAKRLIKEGRLEEWGLDSYIPLKKLYINKIEDLLGSQVVAGKTYDIVGIVDSEVEGILYTDSYYTSYKTHYVLDKTYIHSRSVPYSIYIKYNPNTPQIET